MEARRGCLETAATLQAALQGDGSNSSSARSAAAGGVGGASLLEGVGLVMLQLRGLLSTEEQQRRLLLAERRQLRAAAGSSDGSSGGSNGRSERAAGIGDFGEYFSPGEEDEASDDEFEKDGDDDDDDSEVTSSAAGLSALRNALEELEAVEDALREAHLQVGSGLGDKKYVQTHCSSATHQQFHLVVPSQWPCQTRYSCV